MSNDIITTDLQSQEVDALVELYELELSSSTTLYFHAGVDEALDDIVYDGNTYIALPLMLDGIEASSDGATNRPTLTVANVTNVFKAALSDEGFDFEDLIGKKITRRQTLEKYLVNATYEFPKKVYILDRISAQNNVLVSFELSAPFDVSGIRLPNRVVVGKYCSWLYQGYDTAQKGGCTWTETSSLNYNGTNYEAFFDVDDRPLIEDGLVTFSTWSSGTYALDAFVTHNGKTWRSQTDTNTDTPGTSINWKEVIEWTAWDSLVTYSIGAYVKSGNNIWKALRSSTNISPVTGSLYWTRVDYCGKTLNSCKCRFQFRPTNDGVASAIKETDKVLPFGAFPGSVKFK
jgi:lambda family phage minor tail protein L